MTNPFDDPDFKAAMRRTMALEINTPTFPPNPEVVAEIVDSWNEAADILRERLVGEEAR